MFNWYERRIVPHIIRLGCGCELLTPYRQRLVPQAHGRVLELGVGAGANLVHYDPLQVSHVTAIEPSAELRRFAAQAERPAGLCIDLVDAEGEALPFQAGHFDTVLSTFTLCSVRDPLAVLSEARRVLRPGGSFLFCEHGLAPDPAVRKWQRRLEPLWKTVLGGCHLSRPVRGTIEQYFAIGDWSGGYQKQGPRFPGWIEWGHAHASDIH